MSFHLSYQPFFSIDILHEYYLSEETELYGGEDEQDMLLNRQGRVYNIHRDLAIHPTPDAVQILKDYQLLFKTQPRGLIVGGKVEQRPDSSYIPRIPMDDPLKFRFIIRASNPMFGNFTNLRLDKTHSIRDRYIYYFSNRADNEVELTGQDNLLYLSRSIPAFDPEYSYEAGELVFNNNEIWEALADISPAASIQNSEWITRYGGVDPFPQFVTSADRILLRPHIFDIDVSDAAEERLLVRVLDRSESLLETIRFETHQTGYNLQTIRLNLSRYEPDIYHIEISNTSGGSIPALDMRFYLDGHLYQENPLALIEIVHAPTENLGTYRFLNETDENRLLQPRYTIRWKNRATWWRYYLREGLTNITSDAVQRYEIEPGSFLDNVLISQSPMALTQVTREFGATIDAEMQLLPNPNPNMIFPEGNRVFSEINLGGGMGPPINPNP